MSSLRIALALLALTLPSLQAQDDEIEPPSYRAKVTAAMGRAKVTGRVRLDFEFELDSVCKTPYLVRVQLKKDGANLLDRDHAPKTPTVDWKVGETSRYSVNVLLPVERLTDGGEIEVWIALTDAKRKELICPDDVVSDGDLGLVGWIEAPAFEVLSDEEALAQLIEEARAIAKDGMKAEAWSALSAGIRRSADRYIDRVEHGHAVGQQHERLCRCRSGQGGSADRGRQYGDGGHRRGRQLGPRRGDQPVGRRGRGHGERVDRRQQRQSQPSIRLRDRRRS